MGTGVLYDSGNYLYFGGPGSLIISYLFTWTVLYAVMVTFNCSNPLIILEDVLARTSHSVTYPWSCLHDVESGVVSCNSLTPNFLR